MPLRFGLELLFQRYFLYLIVTVCFIFGLNDKKYEKFLIWCSCPDVRPGGLAFAVSRFFFLILNRVKTRKYLFLYLFSALLGLVYFLPYIMVNQMILEEVRPKSFSMMGKISGFFEVFGFHASRSSLTMAYVLRYFYGIIFLIGFFYVMFPIINLKYRYNNNCICCFFLYQRVTYAILPILYFWSDSN